MAPPANTARRRYDSPRRQQQAAETRAAVLAAATELFTEKGWAGTGMRDVAGRAGVSVETVYATCGAKPDLLLAAIDVGVVGDIEAVPLAQRPEFTALGEGDLGERAAAAAHLARGINERNVGLQLALREASASDDDLASRFADLQQRRNREVGRAAALVAGHEIADLDRDGLWAICGVEVFHLLVHHAHWTPEQYETWLADIFIRTVERPGRNQS